MAKKTTGKGSGASKDGGAPKDNSQRAERGFLRGLQNYGDADFSVYMRRAFAKSMGFSADELKRPVVGIANTYSQFNPCHRHFPELVEAVKRGINSAGGLALEFPTISLHESTLAPNSMKFRNLMAMDTEEMIRGQPMDAVVMLGACDKTVPAQLMGAASAAPISSLCSAQREVEPSMSVKRTVTLPVGGWIMPTTGQFYRRS